MTVAKPTFASRVEITFPLGDGNDITVRSADVGTLLELKAKLLPSLELLANDAPRVFDEARLELIRTTKMVTANDIADLCVLLERADVVVDVVALLAPMPRERVLRLMPDEFAYLFAVLIQVNFDFFVQSLPVLEAARQRIAALSLAGTSSSPKASTP
jgi:hypothetical protein